MTDKPAADAADATRFAEHHLEKAHTCCWHAHPGKSQPDPESGLPEHAAGHASRAHVDVSETT